MESITATPAILLRSRMPDGPLSVLIAWFHEVVGRKQAAGRDWARRHAPAVNVRRRQGRKPSLAERRRRKAAAMRRYRAKCRLEVALAKAAVGRTDWEAWKREREDAAALKKLIRQIAEERRRGVR